MSEWARVSGRMGRQKREVSMDGRAGDVIRDPAWLGDLMARCILVVYFGSLGGCLNEYNPVELCLETES
jgi:hypothetical protein